MNDIYHLPENIIFDLNQSYAIRFLDVTSCNRKRTTYEGKERQKEEAKSWVLGICHLKRRDPSKRAHQKETWTSRCDFNMGTVRVCLWWKFSRGGPPAWNGLSIWPSIAKFMEIKRTNKNRPRDGAVYPSISPVCNW